MPSTRSKEGFVYLFRDGSICKIGHSESPIRRFREVTSNSDRASILHVFPSANPLQVEFALHRRFSQCEVRREWFRLVEEDIALLCALSRVDSADDLPVHLQPPPKQEHRVVAIQARISPSLAKALERLSEKTRRTKNTELILALEAHLKAAGEWPLPDDEDSETNE